MFRLSTISIAVVSSLYITTAQALPASTLPTGGQVAQGQANIQQSANQMQIHQNSQKAVINWNSFNIGKDASVQFQQPNAQSSTLNRVANGSSEIAGQLKANGQVYLLNPNGVLFSPTAQVNTGSLVVATGNTSDEEFLQGTGTLQNSTHGKIINQGNLTAAQGGQIVLASQQIENTGTIQAEQGVVQLLAGQSVRVNVTADGLIQTELHSGGAGNGKIANSGKISATAGQVNVLATRQNSQIQHTGVIEAQSILEKDGKIYLVAGYEGDGIAPKTGTAIIDGRLDASAPHGGHGGFIETSAGQVTITDNAKVTTKAIQGKTGTWLIDPQDYRIAASGGDITGTALSNALNDNNVEILSSSGAIEGEGNIYVNDEVSYSLNQLTLTAAKDVVLNDAINVLGSGTLAVNTGTANGADPADPTGTTRGETGNGYVFFQNAGDGLLTINGEAYRVIKQLGDATSSTNADLQGIQSGSGINYALGDDIDASATATWNGGQGFNPVNLDGQKFNGLGNEISNLTISRPAQDDVGLFGVIENAEVRHLTLNNVDVTGRVDVGALLGRSEFGTNVIDRVVINGGSVSGGELGVGGLAGLTNATVTQSHARNVTVTGVEEVGGLIGLLDGGSVNNVSANGSVNGQYLVGGLIGASYGIGLIDNATASGNVSGLEDVGGLIGELTDTTVDNSSASSVVSGERRVGGLVGDANGWIEDSFATGAVTGVITGSLVGDFDISDSIGGLVGENSGEIRTSYATGKVTGRSDTGGLVGQNTPTGSIIGSYATGDVEGLVFPENDGSNSGAIGGLVGWNNGQVQDSYAQGHVTGDTVVGGLVGGNDAQDDGESGINANIINSYATGNVTGNEVVGGLAGTNVAAGAGKVTISNNSYATGTVSGQKIVGGLVGLNLALGTGGATITDSFATGAVTGVVTGSLTGDFDISDSIGGLVGENYGEIRTSYATGQVTGRSDTGGLVGANLPTGTIIASYATGDVEGLVFAENTFNNAGATGGLVGFNEGQIIDSYAEGAVTGWAGVGGLVGSSHATGGPDGSNEALIDNSYAIGDVSATLEGVGGLVGHLHASNGAIAEIINNSYATGTVEGVRRVGGLVGWNEGGTIDQSHAEGNVTGVTTNNSRIGGLVGENTGVIRESYAIGVVTGDDGVGGLIGDNYGSIEQSYATGRVIGTRTTTGGLVGLNYQGEILNSYATGQVDGVDGVGGLVGDNEYGGTIRHSYATGDVTATGYAAGGLVGANSTSDVDDLSLSADTLIQESYATGNVQGTIGVGGLVGANAANNATSTIEAAYATGTVTGIQYVGGLIGANAAQNGTSTVNQVYATGTVTGSNNVGALVGENRAESGSAMISNGYWDIQTTRQTNAIGINSGTANNLTGMSTEQMHQLASFSNWGADISANGGENTVWRIYEGHTAPLLRNFMRSATLTVDADLQKVYDGTTEAGTGNHTLINTAGDVINQTPPDILGTVNYLYADRNVGTHAVIENGLYSHQQGYDIRVVEGTGTIIPRQLGGGVNVADYQRVYDGTTDISSEFFLTNVVVGDDVHIGGLLAFADKNVGIAKGLQTAYDIFGNNIANYDLNLVDATITATIDMIRATNEITPATLNNVTGITANNRVYDGTSNTTLNTSGAQYTGIIAGDNLAVAMATGQFLDKNVGNAKTVNISGITLTGADAGNYILDNNTATTTANITPATISAVNNITASNRIYDGTTNATLNTSAAQLTGLIAGDNLNITTATGQFLDKNVGNAKTVNISGIILTGADSGNYVLGNNTTTTTANITPRDLNVTASVVDRTYNASTAATVNFDYTPITGDTVNVSGNGSYADANAGVNKTVTLSGLSLTGADATNYTLIAPTTAQGTINRAQIQVIGVKDHDGTAIFTADQLRLRGVLLPTGEYERLSASGTAIAENNGPSRTQVLNGNTYYQTIPMQNVSGVQLLNGDASSLPAGYVAGLASNYQIQNSPQHYAFIYPAHSAHEDIPENGRVIQKLEVTQPVMNSVIFEEKFNVNRINDCQSELTEKQDIPDYCILTPKVEIQVQDAADDDGREATPIKTKRALIIANSAYQAQIGRLAGVKNDSQVVQRSLAEQGYQVTLVNDADRAAMISALNTLIKDSEMDDSVLIYYAGHGYVHNSSSVGYWLPVDATYSNQKDWISNVDISRFVRNIAAKQILLVSDSCFSGSLSYESALQQKTELDRNAVLKRRSVLVMTSGSEEPVTDKGANGLSPFAAAFVQGINQIGQGQSLRGQNLYQTVYQQVTNQYKQYPSYGGLPSAGHNTGGEYIFEKN